MRYSRIHLQAEKKKWTKSIDNYLQLKLIDNLIIKIYY